MAKELGDNEPAFDYQSMDQNWYIRISCPSVCDCVCLSVYLFACVCARVCWCVAPGVWRFRRDLIIQQSTMTITNSGKTTWAKSSWACSSGTRIGNGTETITHVCTNAWKEIRKPPENERSNGRGSFSTIRHFQVYFRWESFVRKNYTIGSPLSTFCRVYHFWLRTRNSIRCFVRPSLRRVGPSVVIKLKSGKTSVLNTLCKCLSVGGVWGEGLGVDGVWMPLPTRLRRYCDPASLVFFNL